MLFVPATYSVPVMPDEQVQALNQITAMVDEKAAKYKDEVAKMPEVRARAEKKLILDLIDNGLDLAGRMKPSPADLIRDLGRLKAQLQNMR